MQTRFRAIAWDIDGTLVDSEPLHHRSLIAASRDFGLDLAAREQSDFTGMHMADIWELLADAFPAGTKGEDWRRAIRAHYAAGIGTLTEIAGARETVARLAELGLRQITVSNSGRTVVDANLAAIGIGNFLEGSISFDDVARGKPDPDPYLRGAALLNLPPQSILAVEDSLPGATAALAAGLSVAGLGAAGTLPGAIAIDTLRDLPELVLSRV